MYLGRRTFSNIQLNAETILIPLDQNYTDPLNVSPSGINHPFSLQSGIYYLDFGFKFQNPSDTLTLASIEILSNPTSIPEPFSLVTLASGCLGIIRKKYSRKKQTMSYVYK